VALNHLHLLLGIAAIVAMLGIMSFTINRFVRRKLRLSVALAAAYIGLHLLGSFTALNLSALTRLQLSAFARLAAAAAVINAAVVLLINPLREDRVPDRFPSILQDALVIALVLLASTFLSEQLLTTSAVSAVVLGFALQDTLGNAFAGLAIQSEKPFHVGHWIRVGEYEGRVTEVTWRATKLRTKTGNLVILPNNFIGKEAITNFSTPTAPLRLEVEVGASYLVPPNAVKAAILEAMRHSPRVLLAPAADAVLASFDGSAITYKARFWVDDFEHVERSRDEVRTAIFYAFQRYNIEIPWPIQVQYERPWVETNVEEQRREQERLLADVDLFAGLSAEVRAEIVQAAPLRIFGNGETIVKQGEPGQSMFLISSGAVSVRLEPSRDEVARIERGGYFGEMSLLTGDSRSATVAAIGDVTAMEVDAELFRRMGAIHPGAIEQIAVAAATRRAGLEERKAAAGAGVAVESATLVARMRRFLRI
jgi:small-conductance mechanosensitive channel/CRP-like cAMP-binding protein